MKKIQSEAQKSGVGRRGSMPLNEGFERRLIFYALAAGAAAVCAPGAQAKVVFTPNNTVLHANHHLDVDLNNDGKTDIRVSVASFKSSNSYFVAQLWAAGAPGNSVDDVGGTSYKRGWAKALAAGAQIGRSAVFLNRGVMIGADVGVVTNGYFENTTDRFVGVSFQINGTTHYGWIGFRQVTYLKEEGDITATLTGWAYETEANTPIIAGDEGSGASDGESAKAAEPTSLELLAAGNVAMAEWRRRRAG
jgi:hypothetical protein